jgi:hypothetical protein
MSLCAACGSEARGEVVISFLAHFLFLLAAWTLVIKYAFPVAYALAEGVPLTTYVYWDFWWVVHIWLGWSLLRWQRYTFEFAIAVSVVEIIIIVAKFVQFLSAPEWTIWRTNWFVNKIFVLACFILLLGYLVVHSRALHRARSAYVPDSS